MTLPPRHTLTLGRAMMIISALTVVITGLIAYPFAARFTLPAQIAAHLLLPISAGLFKLGYVVRLAAHHALGNTAAG